MTALDDTTATQGFVAQGFDAVADQFRLNLSKRGDTGAAFAAVVDGEPVVDLWGGYANRDLGRPWRQDTLAGVYSGTKGLVATCLLLLVERGLLDLEKPVCAYWPEFAAKGKTGILVRHVVSHHSGLPGLMTAVTAEQATDDRRMAQLIADQAAICVPGSRLYYHALTFGWLCGELVRRIDGRSIGRFFRDEIAEPLGMDLWIGLPAEQEVRVAMLQRGPGFGLTKHEGNLDPVAWSIWANPPRFSTDPLPANARFWRAAEVPASNGIVSARSLAYLYGCLARGGEIDGVRLLLPQTIELGSSCIAEGQEPYINQPMAFGVGFQIQTAAAPFGPAAVAFGHNGTGGSTSGAWPELKTGFSYVTSTLLESNGEDLRSAALLRALYDSIRDELRRDR